jgi:hypothetical protein
MLGKPILDEFIKPAQYRTTLKKFWVIGDQTQGLKASS